MVDDSSEAQIKPDPKTQTLEAELKQRTTELNQLKSQLRLRTEDLDRLKAKTTEEYRVTFSRLMLEIAMDASVQATIASELADQLDARKARSWTLLTSFIIVCALPLIPVMYFLATAGMGGWAWAIGSPWAIGLIVAVSVWGGKIASKTEKSDQLRRTSSAYLEIINKARGYHIYDRFNTDKTNLNNYAAILRQDKLDLDKRFHPSVATIERVRVSAPKMLMADFSDDEEPYVQLEKSTDALIG